MNQLERKTWKSSATHDRALGEATEIPEQEVHRAGTVYVSSIYYSRYIEKCEEMSKEIIRRACRSCYVMRKRLFERATLK